MSTSVQQAAVPERARRPLDLISSLLALLGVAIVLAAAHYLPVGSTEMTRQVSRLARHLPRVIVFACAVAAALAAVALLVAVAIRLFRYRTHDGSNAVAAAASAVLLALGAITSWHAFRGGVATAMLHGTDGSTFVRDSVIVAVIAGSDTLRFPGWSKFGVPVITALFVTGIALDEITLLGSVVAVLGGLSVGWFTRWALKSSVRRPSIDALVAGLRRAGIAVRTIERIDDQPNELEGLLADGRRIVLKVAARDVHGARVLARVWSVVRLRGAATGRQPLSVRGALETEALASMMAANAGILAPRVLVLVHFEPDTLVLAREELGGRTLDPYSTKEDAIELFRLVRRLHEVGVAHRDLRAQHLLCGPPVDNLVAGVGTQSAARAAHAASVMEAPLLGAALGELGDEGTEDGLADTGPPTDPNALAAPVRPRVGFRSLEQAVVGAGELVRRLDLAQLLTAVAEALGPSTAVAAMREGYEPGDEGAIAAILQPLALSTWSFREMRAGREKLAQVRRELIGERDVTIEETRLERFRWRTVLGAVAITAAAFLLIGQLKKVNLIGALAHADWAWFSVALVGSALTYFGSSLNLIAFVPKRVSVLKGTLVELAGAFVGLVTPPTVGHVAVNARFLHKEGIDPATTASAVALSQLVNFLTTVLLLILAALLTGTGVGHLKIVPGPRLLAVLGGLVLIGTLLVTVVPPTKDLFWNRLWPRLKGTWPQLLDVLSQPLRMIQGIGGNLLLTSSYVLAFVAALHAVGAHPPIIATAAVFMAGNTVGAAAPTPSGIGAVESVLAAGLAGVGIPAHEAIPGVLLFRLATLFLPIPPGYVVYLILRKRDIL